MSIKMYIFGEAGLLPRNGRPMSSSDLEHALNDFLQGRGEIIWGGDWECDAHIGPEWNVDLLLHADTDDIDGWIQRLAAFFRQWGIPDRTILFTVIWEDGTTWRWEKHLVEVASS